MLGRYFEMHGIPSDSPAVPPSPGHTRPDLVDPPGLAGDMAGGGPEAVLQQEIPVI